MRIGTITQSQQIKALFRRLIAMWTCSSPNKRGVILTSNTALQVADFKTIVFRQQLLGFNAVRLPMTFSDLNLAPKSWTKACTDDTKYLKVSTLS